MSKYLEDAEKQYHQLYQELLAEFKRIGDISQAKWNPKDKKFTVSQDEGTNLVKYMVETEYISDLAYKLKCQYDVYEWEKSRKQNTSKRQEDIYEEAKSDDRQLG